MSKTISLRRYILRRILIAVPIVFIIITLVFFLIHLAPGDPIVYLVGETGASPDYIERLRVKYGLDRPLLEQYWRYLSKVASGDLGYSLIYSAHVSDVILDKLPNTLMLILFAQMFGIAGIILALELGVKQYSFIDDFLSTLAVAGYSLPLFWIGQILIIVFAVKLDLFPMGGLVSVEASYTGLSYVLDALWHTILPALTLGVFQFTLLFRVCKSSVYDVVRENYILAARARGLEETKIKYVHILKNTLIPVITLVSVSIGSLLAGTVLTETVFSWPGLGRTFFYALLNRDYPTIQGVFIFLSVSVVLINLLADVLYGIVDPRVRYT